jgi:uncharacterized protein (DUF58 family)
MAASTAAPPAKRTFRLTRPGQIWCGAALGLLILGLLKNINLLALLGYFLAVAALLNVILAGWGLRSLKVRRRHVNPVFAGRPCPLDVSVAPGRHACPGVRLVERGRDHVLTWYATWLGGRSEQSFRGEVLLPRRGRYIRGELRAVSGYPFGLAEREVVVAQPEEIFVLPRLGSLRRGGLRRHLRGPVTHGNRQHRRPPHPAAQGEVHGLRTFRTGDSPRTIHWKTSARRGELMVREFEDAPGDSLLLVVDPYLPEMPDAGDRFEDAISFAATLAREWCRGGAERLVLAVPASPPLLLDGIAGPAFVQRALEHLAEAVPGSDSQALLTRLAALANPPAGTVVVAVGAGQLAGPLGRLLRRSVAHIDITDKAALDFYTPPDEVAEAERSRIVLHPLGS